MATSFGVTLKTDYTLPGMWLGSGRYFTRNVVRIWVGTLPKRYFTKRVLYQKGTLPKGYFTKKVLYQKGTLPVLILFSASEIITTAFSNIKVNQYFVNNCTDYKWKQRQ